MTSGASYKRVCRHGAKSVRDQGVEKGWGGNLELKIAMGESMENAGEIGL